MSGDRHPWSPGRGDVREAEGMARMILGREPARGSCQVTHEGEAVLGWSGEDLGLERVGQLKRRAPDSAGTLEKGSQQGWVWGAGEGRLGGQGWSTSPSTFFFSLIILLASGT